MAQSTPHFERDSSNNGWTLTKPDPLSIGTDRPMALVQTRRQMLHQTSLTSIVGASFGSSIWLLAVLTEQPGSNTCRCGASRLCPQNF